VNKNSVVFFSYLTLVLIKFIVIFYYYCFSFLSWIC